MLQYKSEFLQDPYMKDLKRSLFACYKYDILESGHIVSTVYASESMTLVYYSEVQLRIERNRSLFSKPHHFIYDSRSEERLGVFEFPNWQNPGKTRCILRMESGPVYSFVQNNEHRRVLKPSTWGRYCFEMTNSDSRFTFDGNRKAGFIAGVDERHIIFISLGLFIIDDKFRTSDETAG